MREDDYPEILRNPYAKDVVHYGFIELLRRLPIFNMVNPLVGGNAEAIELLLDLGVPYDRRMFILAAGEGWVDVIKLFLRRGFRDEWGLPFAAENGRLEMVHLLVNNGFDIHLDNDYALKHAVMNHHPETVRFLLSHGMTPIAISQAFTMVGDIEMAQLLLNYGADIHYIEDKTLRDAVYHSLPNLVEFLLDRGADHLGSALTTAAYENELVSARLLLERGAYVDHGNGEPLRGAAEYGHLEMVRLLLQYGADPHANDNEAIHLAQENNHEDIVRLLSGR